MDLEIIKVSDKYRKSQDDKNFLSRLDSMTVYKEAKYKVPVLWLEEKTSFPKNNNVPLKRFNMLGDPDQRKKYKDNIDIYIEKDYAKKICR